MQWQQAVSTRLARVLGAMLVLATMQVCGALSVFAQQQPEAVIGAASPPSSTAAAITQMSQAAGIIFAGEVIAVHRPAGYAGSAEEAASGLVAVDFRVDDAVRGVAAKSIFTLREWAGLWTGSSERYRVGQHVLLFLHAPNTSGLSSPVHGSRGMISLRGGGKPAGPDDTFQLTGEWLADLSWIQTQLLRSSASTTAPSDLHGTPIHRHGSSAGSTTTEANAMVTPWLTTPVPAATLVPLADLLSQARYVVGASDGTR